MAQQIDWSKFVLEVDGALAIVPCVTFVLFLDRTDEAGILDFYNRSLDALGGQLTHYRTGVMKGNAALTSRARSMVPTWLEDPRPGKSYGIQFSGRPQGAGVSAAFLQLFIDPRPVSEHIEQQEATRLAIRKKLYEGRGVRHSIMATMLRVTFPVDHPLAQPERLVEWVLDLALVKSWPFLSGYAGYALNHYEETASAKISEPMGQQLASLCLRYPGLDWHVTGRALTKLLPYDPDAGDLRPLIKRVNWLSLLCDKSLGYLGGRAAVQQGFANDPEITCYPLDHGLLIRAGEAPQLGDAAARDFIPVYGRVAKVVRPVRMDSIDWLNTKFTEETVSEWLNAFDAGYE